MITYLEIEIYDLKREIVCLKAECYDLQKERDNWERAFQNKLEDYNQLKKETQSKEPPQPKENAVDLTDRCEAGQVGVRCTKITGHDGYHLGPNEEKWL